MFNSNNYPISKAYQAQIIRQVENERMAQIAQSQTAKHFSIPTGNGRIVKIVVIAVAIIVAFFVMPQISNAQDLADADQHEPFAEAFTAYRVGYYYYTQGRYEEAVSQFSQAIDGIPQEIIAISTDYAMMYWTMGDAQVMAGQYEEAIVSYQTFISAAGDNASSEAVAYVESIRVAISSGTTATVSLMGA